MLRIEHLVAGYNGVHALRDVSLTIDQGEAVAIVGPNGAGKSTLLKAVSGTVDVYGGEIHLDDTSLRSMSAHRRADLGVVHVPQGRMIFKRMSVADNLRVGADRAGARARFDERLELVRETFPSLVDLLSRHGGELSGGQQQMLAVARGVMACPSLMMLDEPSEGLAPIVAQQIFESIGRLRSMGDMTLLVVEQRAHEALEICDRAYVFESGALLLESSADALLHDPQLAAAYLGTG